MLPASGCCRIIPGHADRSCVIADLEARISREREALVRLAGVSPGDVRVVVSPYRICPIGAHVDHQLSPVLGMAIAAWTVLAFAPREEPRLRLASRDFPGEVDFGLAQADLPGEGWGRYARGAVLALRDDLPARPAGFVGSLSGSLPGGGLSSSASVLVAYLLALADANGMQLPAERIVRLARRAENEFVGVASGILDPASIVGGSSGRLLHIDTRALRWEPVASGARELPRILVASSGTTRNLARTPFNERVAECRAAAARLALLAGLEGVRVLGDLPDAVFDAHLAELPAAERGRAAHFRGERARVRAGVDAWRRGDLAGFGALMFESCRSSIERYETGSPEQVELQGVLAGSPGILGARFSGAGYGGCSVAFVAADAAEAARRHVEREYLRRVPAARGRASVFLVASEDGARLV
jgi:galactokinase/galacturonokinase